MAIFQQLGQLFLAAVPTAIILFLFFLFLRWSFFGPITRVMKERRARIEGSRKDTERLHAEAEEKRKAHQEALRKVRAQIFTEQEAARQVALDARGVTIQEARAAATAEIHAARERIAAETEEARGEIEVTARQLAEEIVHSILDRYQPETLSEVQ